MKINQTLTAGCFEKLELVPRDNFREVSEIAIKNVDFNLIKISENEYHCQYLSFAKIITGFTIPFFGDVVLESRRVANTMEVGLSNSEALYYYSLGHIKIKLIKNAT